LFIDLSGGRDRVGAGERNSDDVVDENDAHDSLSVGANDSFEFPQPEEAEP
jgi:hypothetical protein